MRSPQSEAFHQQQRDAEPKLSISSDHETVQQQQQKDESRLARVRRALSGSLLGRGSSGSAGGSGAGGGGGNAAPHPSFGCELELVERHNESGLPYVVHRLCGFLEAHGFQNPGLFRLQPGSSRLADRLRLAFERRGDADLEGAACPATAAFLLRQYLKELPRPLVGPTCVSKLLQLHARESRFLLL